MDIVLCHTTADFDTLGAAVGLSCLYQGLRIVLAGGAHPAVREFLAFHRDEYPLMERRSVPVDQIRRIFVVDAQRRDRLGKTAEWLDLEGIEIEVLDHHPDDHADIPATLKETALVGATTTLVVERLQQAGLSVRPVEATVMALGIHADTGSLTFDHTTVRDAEALAWLMGQGANLRTIADYIEPGLSPTLQEWLARSLERLQVEVHHGDRIGTVLLELPEFVTGLSSVVSHLLAIADLDAVLLAARYGENLTVIGRSRIDGTDLNRLFQAIGGGGHARATAANLHAVDGTEVDGTTVLAQLLQDLKAQIPPPPVAQDLMSSPVRTIRPETTIAEAQRILLRYGHSGLSVVDEADQLVGIISRRDLDIALHHGFSHAPVKGYMSVNLKTIAPQTPLPDIEALMVTYDIGRLPVLNAQQQLVGIVTRTDVLRQRSVESPSPHVESSLKVRRPLAIARLAQPLQDLLAIAIRKAQECGWQLYLVGGGVRDLLLANASEPVMLSDIDLVVDGYHQTAEPGAGVALAQELQRLYPTVKLDVHGKFQTAALLWHDDPVLGSLWVDIATARTEFYPYPAANPEVESSSIRQDLYRRDFTINAIALRLTSPRAGEVLDFFGGALDVQAKQIRVLHPNSFIEDPTRIYRAVRFATRLGFTIEPQTEQYIRHAIASGIYQQIQALKGDQRIVAPALQTRLKAELKYMFQSAHWKPALRLLENLGALSCIHATMQLSPQLWHQFRLAELLDRRPTKSQSDVHLWQIRLEILIATLEPSDRAIVARTLQLSEDGITRLERLATAETSLHHCLAQSSRPSTIAACLQDYDEPLLHRMFARGDRTTRRIIWRYLTVWLHINVPLNGHDLRQMGLKPGPQFRDILAHLWAAVIDGDVSDRPQAEAFVQQFIQSPPIVPQKNRRL